MHVLHTRTLETCVDNYHFYRISDVYCEILPGIPKPRTRFRISSEILQSIRTLLRLEMKLLIIIFTASMEMHVREFRLTSNLDGIESNEFN